MNRPTRTLLAAAAAGALLVSLTGTAASAHDDDRDDRDGANLDDVDLARAMIEKDRRVEMRSAFDRLSPEDRELLELRVVARLSADGVATATGSTAGAVRTAQSRALHRLRTHYEAVTHEH